MSNFWAVSAFIVVALALVAIMVHNKNSAGVVTASVFGLIVLQICLVVWLYSSPNSPKPDGNGNGNGSSNEEYITGPYDNNSPPMDIVGTTPKKICVNGDYGDDEWDAGYKVVTSTPTTSEQWLAQLGRNTMRDIAAQQTVSEFEECSVPDPNRCPMKTDWQGAFKGLPTTFITPPAVAGGTCDVSGPKNTDGRAWFRSLDDEYERRSRINSDKWDPYKHLRARQMHAQFLSNGVTNRKAFYERPIEQLEEATCFQNLVKQNCRNSATL